MTTDRVADRGDAGGDSLDLALGGGQPLHLLDPGSGQRDADRGRRDDLAAPIRPPPSTSTSSSTSSGPRHGGRCRSSSRAMRPSIPARASSPTAPTSSSTRRSVRRSGCSAELSSDSVALQRFLVDGAATFGAIADRQDDLSSFVDRREHGARRGRQPERGPRPLARRRCPEPSARRTRPSSTCARRSTTSTRWSTPPIRRPRTWRRSCAACRPSPRTRSRCSRISARSSSARARRTICATRSRICPRSASRATPRSRRRSRR